MHWLVRGADGGRSKRFRGEDENADQETVFQIRVAKYIGDGGDFAVYSGGHLFISLSVGADGITALNLVLPIYSLIFAIGAMIGVGAAIRFAVAKGKGEKNADAYFSNALFLPRLRGLCFWCLAFLHRRALSAFWEATTTLWRRGSIYPDFHAVRTLLYVELHLQRFCAQ